MSTTHPTRSRRLRAAPDVATVARDILEESMAEPTPLPAPESRRHRAVACTSCGRRVEETGLVTGRYEIPVDADGRCLDCQWMDGAA